MDQDTSLWRLTRYGGCARKAPASVTLNFAQECAASQVDPTGFMADVGVVEVDGKALGLTVDFITPVVPDPADYGRIAAANALSDAYAAGMVPRHALAIACAPTGEAADSFTLALKAASEYLRLAGCSLVGGHSVTDAEPKLGFAVLAVPNSTGRLLTTGAQAGDTLLLTKPLGVGVLTSARRAGLVDDDELSDAVDTMLASNSFVITLVEGGLGRAIHAATDVTGFGLLGHLKELCVRSGVGARLHIPAIPVLDRASELADRDVHTSASSANLDYVETECSTWLRQASKADQIILTDPQTAGGLLLSVDTDSVEAVLEEIAAHGFRARAIGSVTSSAGTISASW